MLSKVLTTRPAQILTRRGFYQPVSNPVLKQVGVMDLQVSSGASRLETAAVLLRLKTLTHRDFKAALAIQQKPHFNFIIDRVQAFARHLILIKDHGIRNFTQRALEKAAPEFFLKPSAIMNSKFHPIDEFSIGGQIMHSCRTAELGIWLHRALFPNEAVSDLFIAGLLLHDICSHIKISPNGDLVFIDTSAGHAIEGTRFLRDLAQREFPGLLDQLEPIFNMIYFHFGRWEKSVDTTLTPQNNFYDWFLSATDIIAAFSRSCITYRGIFPWHNPTEICFSSIDGWLINKNPLPANIQDHELNFSKQAAIVMAKIFFEQYAVEDKARQDKIILSIICGRKLPEFSDKQELTADVDKFIAAVCLAMLEVPSGIFNLQVKLSEIF